MSNYFRYNVLNDWLDDIRLAHQDSILELADHLSDEAAEALLDLATDAMPQIIKSVLPGGDPYQHPDALRRFRIMNNDEELERALDYHWEKRTIRAGTSEFAALRIKIYPS